MSEYPNSGTISKNDKGDNPKRPDYKGSGEIDGVEYWLSGWVKTGQNGSFLSLSFKKKDEKPQQEPPVVDDSDSIPF